MKGGEAAPNFKDAEVLEELESTSSASAGSKMIEQIKKLVDAEMFGVKQEMRQDFEKEIGDLRAEVERHQKQINRLENDRDNIASLLETQQRSPEEKQIESQNHGLSEQMTLPATRAPDPTLEASNILLQNEVSRLKLETERLREDLAAADLKAEVAIKEADRIKALCTCQVPTPPPQVLSLQRKKPPGLNPDWKGELLPFERPSSASSDEISPSEAKDRLQPLSPASRRASEPATRRVSFLEAQFIDPESLGSSPASSIASSGRRLSSPCISGSVQRWQRGNLIGSGSYGKVFLGMNLDSGELFAVKQVQFKDKQGREHEEVVQLEQEIAVLATLQHDNIVKYLGTERNPKTDQLSIFLEHMPGGSLAHLVEKFGRLDESVIRKYTREMLAGLQYLHDRGIIHRDIKGQNILVDNRGICKLADFGCSRILQNATGDDAVNMSFKGTPIFMSPEVIMEQAYSKKSDVWSVGCTLIQMASGNPPFSEFSNPIAASFHITGTEEPPELPSALSEACKDFILQCFIRDTTQRPLAHYLARHAFLKPPMLRAKSAHL